MSENEMMNAKMKPEMMLDWMSGRRDLDEGLHAARAKAHRCLLETRVEPNKAGRHVADHEWRANDDVPE